MPNASGEAWRRRLVRCAIYTRQSVSSSDSLSSCDVQYDACRLYLEPLRELGWTLLPERFDDEGYSGASLDRPALSRLLAHIRHGAVDQVLIHRFDRLSRDVRDCVTLLDEIRRLEVGLVVVTAPELGHSAQDNFLLNIMASFAEFEREMIAGRIADSRARLKARRLRFAGGVPFGYDADARTKQFIPNETEAAIVRWMFAEAAAGQEAIGYSGHGERARLPNQSAERRQAMDGAPGSVDAAQPCPCRDAEGRPRYSSGNSSRHRQPRTVRRCGTEIRRAAHTQGRALRTHVAVEGKA